MDFDSILSKLQTLEKALSIPLFLVGGAVRDHLLGLPVKDWDLTTPILPEIVEEKIRKLGRKPFLLGKKFGTIGLKWQFSPGQFEMVEITTFRQEIYAKNSRKPEVEFVQNIQSDLSRRDFTINAMALDSLGQIYDFFDGQTDLKNGQIRAVGNPKIRFLEDPLRILRAIRFASSLGFQIEDQTWDKLCKMRFELLKISKERWVLEMDKILSLQNPKNLEKGLDLLMESGLLTVMMPELSLQKNFQQNSPHHDFDLWTHTKKVVQNVPADNLDLRWTALLHDIAKPFVQTQNKNGHSNYLHHQILGAEISKKISSYLKFSNDRQEFIFENILNHLEPNSPLKVYDDEGKRVG